MSQWQTAYKMHLLLNSKGNYMQTTRQSLHTLAPMLQGNLANDTNGDIVVVYADAWAAAYYFVHGVIV